MSVAGNYDCVTKTPMGDQKGMLTVIPHADGKTFIGSIAGDLGTMEITDGTIDGNHLNWTMNMTAPMPMDLECKATVEGDTITGEVRAGAFGAMPLAGTRAG